MALGAQRDRLLQLMLFDGLRLRPALFSLGLGLLLSFAATRAFLSMLSGNQASRSLGSLRRDCDTVGAYAAGKASRAYQYMSRLVWIDVPYFSFNPVPDARGCCRN